MTKYHIKRDGTPGICRAKEGNCPLGSISGEVFDNREDTQAAIIAKDDRQAKAYKEKLMIGGEPASDYQKALLKPINSDGLAIESSANEGTMTATYGDSKVTFSPEQDSRVKHTDFMDDHEGEQKWRVTDVDGKTYTGISDEQLDEMLNSVRDMEALEENTRNAVSKWKTFVPTSSRAMGIQNKIKRNEELLGKTMNVALHNQFRSKKAEDRIRAAESGYKHDVLINDEDEMVRATVANREYGLDTLKSDESPLVRAVVADKGYAHDELFTDEDPSVRAAVASKGSYSQILAKDPDPQVRAAVAKSGKELDSLTQDENDTVRFFAVSNLAPGKYGLGRFADDKSSIIRKYVEENNK